MTSFADDTREGKGRVHPGPSPSTHSRQHGREPGSALALLGAVVVLIASVASSVFGTQAHQHSSPAALALVAAFGSYVGVILTVGLSRARSRGIAEWLPQTLAGAGGLAVAPWLVMANRYTDAPPGSEVVFFSVASWGAMLAIALAVASNERVSRIGGVVLALAGTAGVVANWERPSSFSPLVRFPREEAFMLAAGALWVIFVLVLAAAARRKSLPSAALRASLGGIAGAVAIGGISALRGTLVAADFGSGVVAYGISAAFLMSGMLIVLRSRSAFGVAAAYLLVPATMTLLLLLEEVFGSWGPNPLLVGPIIAGTLATVAGLCLAARTSAESPSDRCSTRFIARALAVLAVGAAAAAFALPGMIARVSALRADGTRFEASFTLHGFEVVGTWLALGIAVAALGIALESPLLRSAWVRALALVASIAAWPFVASTPMRTLTSFIPSDVQVDYGSEFARIDFTGGPPLLAALALGGALLAVAVTLACRASRPKTAADEATRDDREAVS